MSEPAPIHCPSCGKSDVTLIAEGLARCDECGTEFLVQTEEPAATEEAGTLAYQTPGDEGELSELRIRNVSNLRRGAYRERSYWIIGAGVFLVAAAKLVQIGCVAWGGNMTAAATGDFLGAVAALLMFVGVAGRVGALTREIRGSRLGEVEEPPDFSGLGDGSQRVKDLEAMTGSDPPEPT